MLGLESLLSLPLRSGCSKQHCREHLCVEGLSVLLISSIPKLLLLPFILWKGLWGKLIGAFKMWMVEKGKGIRWSTRKAMPLKLG